MRGSGALRTGVTPGGALAGPWVQNPLWTAARAVPSLDLRFADNKSLIDAVTGASLVTFTRASSGTFVDSAGTLQTAAVNAPRFDHNPTTGESLGLLVEEQRTNLLLNSGTLSTQSATVTAVAHTLHFTGTGTITLTGASTAGPLVGTGTGEANRVSLTFTPTAGSLTLTVSGTVTNAQLEAGAFRTSYIATAGATATRAADVASITGSAFSSWYRQDEGTLFATYQQYATGGNVVNINDGTISNFINIFTSAVANAKGSCNVFVSGANNGRLDSGGTFAANTPGSAAYALANGSRSFLFTSGTTSTSATPATMPTVNQLRIGYDANSASHHNGTIRRLCYWNQRLANSTLQQITQ
jgi:hypothetical protein